MSNAALIVAAGRGSRMMRDLPKQYLPLGKHVVLWHTIRAFLASEEIDQIRVVIHPADHALYEAAVAEIDDPRLGPPVDGGPSRGNSVRLGLEALTSHYPKHVLIHDAARPFCPPDLIRAVLAPLDKVEGAFAALPVVDALWQTENGQATKPIPRKDVWRAQTPQAFHYGAILQAHRTLCEEVADDVEAACQAGLTVKAVKGLEGNFKITYPSDLARAKLYFETNLNMKSQN